MNAYEVFAYWNGQDIFNALNSVAAIMGGGDYLGLMKAVGIVGLLAAISFALLSQKGSAAGSYFMGFVFIYSVMFVPKVTVIVNDMRAATVYTVANVPLGLAAPYATISRIGNFLTQQYEARFTTLDDERFSKTGMVFGARVLETMAIQGFPDPTLKSDVTTFYKDCIVPELIEDGTKAKLLKNSKDIAVTMQSIVNPGRGTVMGAVQFAGSTAMSCSNVIPAFNTYLTTSNVTQESLEKIGRTVHGDQGVSASSAVLIAATESDVTNMLTNLMAISDSAQQSLAQSMWLNGIHDADMALRNGYGNSQSTSYATAVTEQSSRQSAYTGKLWAEKALPLIRNIAEFVLIAAFPLVFIIMLVAGENALKVVKLYLTVLTSLALWAPFTAILNYLVISNGKQAILAMKATGGGITLENVNGLIDLALQQQSLAGQLFLAVPMVAYALVSAGAQAATAAVGGLTSSATGAAGQVSGQTALGNVGGGQVGWRNVNAFNTTTGQSNTAMSTRAGFTQEEGPNGTVVRGPGGSEFASFRDSSAGAFSAQIGNIKQNVAQKAFTANAAKTKASIASALDSIRQGTTSGFKSENMQKAEASLKASDAATSSTERSRALVDAANHTVNAANEAAAQHTKRTSTSLTAGLGGSGGGGKAAAGGSGKAGVGIEFADQHSTGQKQATQGQSAVKSDNSKKSGTGTEGKDEASTSATNSNSSGSFRQSALDNAKQFAAQASTQAQRTLQASEMISGSNSDSGTYGQNLTQQILNGMGGPSIAMQKFGQDQAKFGQEFQAAAEKIIADKGLGSGAMSQVPGFSGGTPTTSQVTGAVDGLMSAAAKDTANTPSSASITAAQVKTEMQGDASQQSSPLDGRSGGNPFGSPVQPVSPGGLARPDGTRLDGAQLKQFIQTEGRSTQKEISDEQALVNRKVGNETDRARNR